MAFKIPFGYVLVDSSTGEVIKTAGEMSGSRYGLRDVLDGRVPDWQLVPTGEYRDVSPVVVHKEVYQICDALEQAGGNALFAGGIVRDGVLGTKSKDVDIEVYGVDKDTIINALTPFGKVDAVGASFGVIKVRTQNNEYDVSIPRRESKAGKGHKGFIVEPDPSMSYEDAASRRDYTINSLGMTPGGRLIDYFEGLRDLYAKTLRHTSEKFVEDPLRVLRGFQLAARFGLKMAPETAELCQSLRSTYAELPVERVWTEWEKWAEKSTKPSDGIQVLLDTGWLELYPELFAMKGVQQDPEWHPEGDVLVHTMHVVDAAADIAERENMNSKDRLVLLFAALCHDLGKPETTVMSEGRWRAPAHASEGKAPTIRFLKSIGAPAWLIEQVVPLVAEHMVHIGTEMTDRVVRRLANRIFPANIKMLAHVIEADVSGRPPLEKKLPEEARKMVTVAEGLKVEGNKAPRLLGGKDLLSMADNQEIPPEYMKPGKHFGVLLDYLYEKQLDGVFTTAVEGKEFLREMFDIDRQERVSSNIEFIRGLTHMRLRFLTIEAEKRGLNESSLMELPLIELKKMAKLAVSSAESV